MEVTESICSTISSGRFTINRGESVNELTESSLDCEFDEGMTVKLEEQAQILEKHTKDMYKKIINKIQEQTRKNGKRLHISYCISTEDKASREIYSTLVQLVNGRDDGIYLGSQSHRDWHALSSFLELKRGHIEAISNKPENRVDLLLRFISQYKNKTMTDLVNALIKMRAFDILHSLCKPLTNMAKQVYESASSGYESQKSDLYRPKNIHLNLPRELLLDDYYEESSEGQQDSLCIDHLSSSNDTPVVKLNSDDFITFSGSSEHSCTNQNRIRKKILLTYTEDGINEAVMIRCEILKKLNELQNFSVTFLSFERLRHEIQNAYQANKFVAALCDEADFIIPIMTPQYLKQIKEDKKVNLQANNLDHELVRLVYERQGTMTCLNFERNKVRSFLNNESPDVENIIKGFKKLTYNNLFTIYKTPKNLNQLIDILLLA